MRKYAWAGLLAGVSLLAACGVATTESDSTGSVENTEKQASEQVEAPSVDTSAEQADESADRAKPSEVSADTAVFGDPIPFNGRGLFGGPAEPTFPTVESADVSVVKVFAPEDLGPLHLVFHNDTADTISQVEWQAVARSDGKLVNTGISGNIIPAELEPGETGIALIGFVNPDALPENSEYEFVANWEPGPASGFLTERNLTVTEVDLVGDALVGAAVNQTDTELEGLFSVNVLCFEGEESLTSRFAFADQSGAVAPGEKVTFSLSVYQSCPNYLVSVAGHLD